MSIFSLDEETGYIYNFDYGSSFVSPQQKGDAFVALVQRDFISNLENFLSIKLLIHQDYSATIASAVYTLISESNRYFFTPYKVLQAFIFSFQNKIPLTTPEQLSIWFRDIIKIKGSTESHNRSQSAQFMRSVLPNGFRLDNNVIVNEAERIILSSQDDDIQESFCYMSDLDLLYFTFKLKIFEAAIACYRQEFCAYGNSFQKFKQHLLEIATNLTSRKSIFKNPKVISMFEEQAVSNLIQLKKALQ